MNLSDRDQLGESMSVLIMGGRSYYAVVALHCNKVCYSASKTNSVNSVNSPYLIDLICLIMYILFIFSEI